MSNLQPTCPTTRATTPLPRPFSNAPETELDRYFRDQDQIETREENRRQQIRFETDLCFFQAPNLVARIVEPYLDNGPWRLPNWIETIESKTREALKQMQPEPGVDHFAFGKVCQLVAISRLEGYVQTAVDTLDDLDLNWKQLREFLEERYAA